MKNLLCPTFIFCYLWAIGGNLSCTHWENFDNFIKKQFEENRNAKVERHPHTTTTERDQLCQQLLTQAAKQMEGKNQKTCSFTSRLPGVSQTAELSPTFVKLSWKHVVFQTCWRQAGWKHVEKENNTEKWSFCCQ